MSLLPIMVEGESVSALVVGGGRVGARKACLLASAGVRVTVVAPAIDPALRRLADESPARLTLVEREFSDADIGEAALVVAATDNRGVNARVAAAARAAGRLVNVADDPAAGHWVGAATHRIGDVVIAITTGGVPAAATRIRDEIALRIDARYGEAVSSLALLRRRLLSAGGREKWRDAERELIGPDFCASVESGGAEEKARRWA